MFYYSGDSLGMASLEAHADAITLLAPQCYELDRAGALHGKFPRSLWRWQGRAGLPLMPLVTNSGFDRVVAHALLHNAKAQARAATNLAEVAERDNTSVGNSISRTSIPRTSSHTLGSWRASRAACITTIAC